MRFALPVVVFVSGAVVMVLELAASRIIAPYLGTSVIVWTSLIGVMLAALALGNLLGGRLADRYPAPRTLAGALLVGSILVALSAHFQGLLSVIASGAELQGAAVLAVLALFGPATVVLGTIAPLAVKLSLNDLSRGGRVVGNLYALSNAGSIAGTFLGGFILISYFGSTRIIIALAVTLALLAVVVLVAARAATWRWGASALVLFALLSVPPQGAVILGAGERLLRDVDTRYSRTWIAEQDVDGGTLRTLSNAVGGYQSGALMHTLDEPFFAYVRMLDVFEAFVPEATSALMIGGSAYTYPQHFLKDASRRATVVEIDPGVTLLARTYFGLRDDPRLTIIHEDGRVYLNKNTDTYDLIVVDAFSSSLTIPFQLTTQEAAGHMKRALAGDGVVMVNIISALEGAGSAFLAAEYATYRTVFPHVKVYQVESRTQDERQNLLLIASHEPLTPRADSPYAATLEQKRMARGHRDAAAFDR